MSSTYFRTLCKVELQGTCEVVFYLHLPFDKAE